MTAAPKNAANARQPNASSDTLVRVVVEALSGDAELIKAVAEVLRGGSENAENLRLSLETSLAMQKPRDAFDVFGSDLPDEVFEGVFGQPRQGSWREVEF